MNHLFFTEIYTYKSRSKSNIIYQYFTPVLTVKKPQYNMLYILFSKTIKVSHFFDVPYLSHAYTNENNSYNKSLCVKMKKYCMTNYENEIIK